MTPYLVFDVESIGLHGEGFAVGWVVVDKDRNILDSGLRSCPSSAARGSKEGHEWVRDHVPDMRPSHTAPWMVRTAFWREWQRWKVEGALLVADCAWPVEARFLAQCVDDDPLNRTWDGPYPLHDLASILLARGLDPLKKNEREPNELPEHNPLCDATQSARLLLNALHPL